MVDSARAHAAAWLAALSPAAVDAAVATLDRNLAQAAAGAGPAERLRTLLDRSRGHALEDRTQHAAVQAAARARVARSCAAEAATSGGGGSPEAAAVLCEAERAEAAAQAVLQQARAAAEAHLARLEGFAGGGGR